MGVLELAVSGEIVDNRDFSVCSCSRSGSHGEFGVGLVGRVRAGFRVAPFIGDLEVGKGWSSSGSDSHFVAERIVFLVRERKCGKEKKERALGMGRGCNI